MGERIEEYMFELENLKSILEIYDITKKLYVYICVAYKACPCQVGRGKRHSLSNLYWCRWYILNLDYKKVIRVYLKFLNSGKIGTCGHYPQNAKERRSIYNT